MEIKAKEITMVDIDLLVENPKNNNIHPQEQIERLAKIIKSSGFRNPLTVSNRSGFVLCGHGRIAAAKLAGLKQLPVIYQDFKDEAEEYAHMTADNAIASWAKIDLSMVNVEMLDLGPELDIEMLGIKDFKVELYDPDSASSSSSSSSDDRYTKKIEIPIYEPKGLKPEISELLDTSFLDKRKEKIEALKIPDEVKDFLRYALYRHNVFNYEKIAEYYSHASKEIQDIFEELALVIIDFDKAIENGFVKMTESMTNYIGEEQDEE